MFLWVEVSLLPKVGVSRDQFPWKRFTRRWLKPLTHTLTHTSCLTRVEQDDCFEADELLRSEFEHAEAGSGGQQHVKDLSHAFDTVAFVPGGQREWKQEDFFKWHTNKFQYINMKVGESRFWAAEHRQRKNNQTASVTVKLSKERPDKQLMDWMTATLHLSAQLKSNGKMDDVQRLEWR